MLDENLKGRYTQSIKSGNSFGYFLLLILIIIILFILLYAVFFIIELDKSAVSIHLSNIDDFIKLVLVFTGFLSASSVISIFTVYNTYVNKDKEFRSLFENLSKDLKNQVGNEIQLLKDQQAELVQKEDFSKKISVLNEDIKILKHLFYLTSPYYDIQSKRELLKELENDLCYCEYRPMVIKYYDDLQKNNDDTSENNLKFIEEFKELVNKWNDNK